MPYSPGHIPPNRKLRRNLEIARAIEAGERVTHVAERYGISKQAASSIWKRYGNSTVVLPTGKPPRTYWHEHPPPPDAAPTHSQESPAPVES